MRVIKEDQIRKTLREKRAIFDEKGERVRGLVPAPKDAPREPTPEEKQLVAMNGVVEALKNAVAVSMEQNRSTLQSMVMLIQQIKNLNVTVEMEGQAVADWKELECKVTERDYGNHIKRVKITRK